MMEKIKSSPKDVNKNVEKIKYLIALFIYGTVGLVVRYVDFPSEAVAMYRAVFGVLFLLIYMKMIGKEMDTGAIKRNMKWLIVSGISLSLNWIFLFISYVKTTVAIGSLCNYTATVTVVLIAPIVLHERIDKRKLPLIAAAFFGVVMISGVLEGGVPAEGEGYDHVTGVIMGLLASAAFTVILIANRKMTGMQPLDRAVTQLFIGSLVIVPYTFINNGGIPLPKSTLEIVTVFILGAFYTAFAYIFYFSGVSSLPVHTIAILGFLEPVVALLSSLLVLREPMSVMGWAGTVLILGSAVISETMPDRKA